MKLVNIMTLEMTVSKNLYLQFTYIKKY